MQVTKGEIPDIMSSSTGYHTKTSCVPHARHRHIITRASQWLKHVVGPITYTLNVPDLLVPDAETRGIRATALPVPHDSAECW